MFYDALKALHLLSLMVWVGGMAYTLFFLRPAVATLEAPQRVALMYEVLRRFFAAVLPAIALVLITGASMLAVYAGRLPATPEAVVTSRIPWNWHAMAALGVLMAAIFGHIRYVLFNRLRLAVLEQKWTAGGAALAGIRTWVRVNLAIGILIVLIA